MEYLAIEDFTKKFLVGKRNFIAKFEYKNIFLCGNHFIKQYALKDNSLGEGCNELIFHRQLQKYFSEWFIIPLAWSFDDDSLYIVWEKVQTINEFCKQNGHIDINQVYEDLKQGIARMRGLNIAHNDIKPENIMYHDGKFKFIDFGLATVTYKGYIPPATAFSGFFRDPRYCSTFYNSIDVELFALSRTLEDIMYASDKTNRSCLSSKIYFEPKVKDEQMKPLLISMARDYKPDIQPIYPSERKPFPIDEQVTNTKLYKLCEKYVQIFKYHKNMKNAALEIIKRYLTKTQGRKTMTPSVLCNVAMFLSVYLNIDSRIRDDFTSYKCIFEVLKVLDCDCYSTFEELGCNLDIHTYQYTSKTLEDLKAVYEIKELDKQNFYPGIYVYLIALESHKLTNEERELAQKIFPQDIWKQFL